MPGEHHRHDRDDAIHDRRPNNAFNGLCDGYRLFSGTTLAARDVSLTNATCTLPLGPLPLLLPLRVFPDILSLMIATSDGPAIFVAYRAISRNSLLIP